MCALKRGKIDAKTAFLSDHRNHWDAVAKHYEAHAYRWNYCARGYHQALTQIYRHLVPVDASILELGCGTGDLLAALGPRRGVGVDLAPEMVRLARARHSGLEFHVADAAAWDSDEQFDIIICSDLLNDMWDVQRLLNRMRAWCHPGTRCIFNVWSRLWQLPMSAARRLGLATPLLEQNWFTPEDIANLLHLENFSVIKQFSDIFCPAPIPLLSGFCNRYLAKLPLFRLCDWTNVIVARPAVPPDCGQKTVSVIVPARNESGNIAEIIRRTPHMGKGTELIFVEGNSTDDTWQRIQDEVAQEHRANPNRIIRALQQRGKGKGDAARTGFAAATGDIVMILDADMTVPPEDLPLFYDALNSGRCEFVNGVRLVYPMESQAMRFLIWWPTRASVCFSPGCWGSP